MNCFSIIFVASAALSPFALTWNARSELRIPEFGNQAVVTPLGEKAYRSDVDVHDCAKANSGKSDGTIPVFGSLADADSSPFDDGSPADIQRLALHAPQKVTVEIASTDFTVYLALARSVGSKLDVVASAKGESATLSYTCAESGEYALLISTVEPGGRGRYSGRIIIKDGNDSIAQAPIDQGTRAGVGRVFRGHISEQDQRLSDGSFFSTVTFSGRAGDLIDLRLISSDFDPYLALVIQNEGGRQVLAENDDAFPGQPASGLRVKLPIKGEYACLATSYRPGSTGEFELHIERADAQQGTVADWSARYPGGGNPDERYALLVGIDDYPQTQSDLGSCVADTRVMAALLVHRFGFKPQNIVIINDADATREHIAIAFRRHLGQAGPKGTAFFYFSGHGSQVPDTRRPASWRHKPDHLDEVIVTWSQAGKASYIEDWELAMLIQGLRTTNAVMTLDSCHSGTATRLENVKGLTLEQLKAMGLENLKQSIATAVEICPEEPTNHVLLAACRADETAGGGTVGMWPGRGRVASVFTYCLAEVLDAARADATFDQVIRETSQTVAAHVSSAKSEPQTPQCEGRQKTATLGAFFSH